MDLVKLAKEIETGQRAKQNVDITQFFMKTKSGDFVPNPKKRIQVRDRDRDLSFIERTVNKLRASGDISLLSALTSVWFPEEEDERLLNGNHTAEIEMELGLRIAPRVLVDFEKDLGGKMSNVIRLGNLLNKQEFERTSTEHNDVKKELYAIMDERIAEGKDARPSDEQIDELITLYPFIDRRTVGQWISYHCKGSRRAPMKSYLAQELKEQKEFYSKQRKYRDYVILEPRTLEAWESTGVAQAFIQAKKENKSKVLIIFYCSSVAQVEKLDNGEDVKIEKFYKELGEHYGLTFEVDFLSAG